MFFAAATFSAAVFSAVVGGTTVFLPVILSTINFVPAPSAAPVSALTIVLAVEFGALGLLIAGRETVGADVVFVAGAVDFGTVTLG